MEISSNVYSEVYSFLEALGYSFISKIPEREYLKIIDNTNPIYHPKYILSDFKNDLKISKQSQYIILFFHYKYCCSDEEEKNKVLKKLNELEQSLNYRQEIFKKNNN